MGDSVVSRDLRHVLFANGGGFIGVFDRGIAGQSTGRFCAKTQAPDPPWQLLALISGKVTVSTQGQELLALPFGVHEWFLRLF